VDSNNRVQPPRSADPTGSERSSLIKDCGWKDGHRGGSVKKLRSTERNTKTVLTPTGLLMEGVTSDCRLTRT
jgi:hypothetical protein